MISTTTVERSIQSFCELRLRHRFWIGRLDPVVASSSQCSRQRSRICRSLTGVYFRSSNCSIRSRILHFGCSGRKFLVLNLRKLTRVAHVHNLFKLTLVYFRCSTSRLDQLAAEFVRRPDARTEIHSLTEVLSRSGFSVAKRQAKVLSIGLENS